MIRKEFTITSEGTVKNIVLEPKRTLAKASVDKTEASVWSAEPEEAITVTKAGVGVTKLKKKTITITTAKPKE